MYHIRKTHLPLSKTSGQNLYLFVMFFIFVLFIFRQELFKEWSNFK